MRTLAITVAALVLAVVLTLLGGIAVTPSPASQCQVPTYDLNVHAVKAAHIPLTYQCGN